MPCQAIVTEKGENVFVKVLIDKGVNVNLVAKQRTNIEHIRIKMSAERPKKTTSP